MRVLRVYLTLLVLLLLSAAAGIVASDWPSWCHVHHWCTAGFPGRPGALERDRQALKSP